MLVQTFDEYELQKTFREWDRDYFSLEGYQALLDYFEKCDCGNYTELDVVAICCDFTEEEPKDIIEEYDNIDDIKECIDEDGEVDIDALMDALKYRTWAVELSNGNILYLDF